MNYFGPPDASNYLAEIGFGTIGNRFSDFSDIKRGNLTGLCAPETSGR